MQEKLAQQRRDIEQQMGLTLPTQAPQPDTSEIVTLKYGNSSMPRQSGESSPQYKEGRQRRSTEEAEVEGLDIDAEIDDVLEELFNESGEDSMVEKDIKRYSLV